MPIFQDDLDGGDATTPQPPDHSRPPSSPRPSRTKLIQRLKRGRLHGIEPERVSPPLHGPLLPPVHIKPSRPMADQPPGDSNVVGLDIERPGSALHSGDFTHDKPHGLASTPQPRRDDWIAASHRLDTGAGPAAALKPIASPSSSWSLSCSFAYQPPTSPLVQSEINDESISLSSRSFPHGLASSSPFFCHRALPYQAHQPRRSLTSTPASSPQTPVLGRVRRPSVGSDLSPMQHASMVGSYEESILRGRMSTTPSKPFDFLAQIGVLARGKGNSTLVCPPHVTLEFPAVYYKYSSTPLGPWQVHDGPSPYVGLIDLENGLPNPDDESRAKRKAHTRQPADRDAQPKPKTPSAVRCKPRAPPGGSYRIPEKGQLQIIVKNQNKTAVKLFLVPYDLTGMEPSTKTFIRQRSYSSGPMADGVDEAPDGLPSRPILRYLVHVHICCPSKGRFYLYKSIRIVFANRVVDGKETLRNETTWPEPRFAPYKPVRVMHPPAAASGLLAADKASRRRSLDSDPRPADVRVWGATHYEKLSRGDAGYGGHCFADSPQGKRAHGTGEQRPLAGAESLLSQRLRSLGVESLRTDG
ncbi:hypothetical protein CDD82_7237 [Ophiocordyceps australis]|uniref:Atos-like conserved domain-containing protein n=1 Tax=Ophiocordyceps australis TaxID=1399860 RepID=A0A2C5YTM8_9HYPO|nr:hypothetical protein CDD82_7237 [Ophiocordyceps australis]